MTPTTPPTDAVALQRAVTALRAGAEAEDAARAFDVDLDLLLDAERKAGSELAVYAAGMVRQALANPEIGPQLALDILDRQAARNELARLKELTDG